MTDESRGFWRVALVALAACALALPLRAGAQGTVSAQGFGYPPGELSTRALGTGGALGEIDPLSPLNPAALAIGGVSQVYAQYDPEVRTESGPGGSGSTMTPRFPNVGTVLPLGRKLVFGLSAATLLDRSWSTTSTQPQAFGPDTTSATETLRSAGGITDVRLAVAYLLAPRVRVGIAGHFFTGSTQVNSRDVFSDTLRFRNISQTANLSYAGRAVSAGVEVDILPTLSLALDGRRGTSLRMYAGDSLLTAGRVPDRYAASLSFGGLPGTLISVRAAHERWSAMDSLSTAGTQGRDGNDFGVGIESRGPRVGAFPVLLRVGARRRTLPFPAAGATVTETSYGGGLGIPVAYDRVTLDLAALRDVRTGVPGVNEHAYTFSIGLRVRP